MAIPKTYKLYVQRSMKILMIGVLVIFTAAGALMFSGLLKDQQGHAPPPVVGVFMIVIIGINLYFWVLSLPHTIRVADDGSIEFISIVRRKRVMPREIRSIRPDNGQLGYLTVRTDSGRVRLLNQFDGFHEFITWLKENNPAIELRGC
jgi:hypothetical protein